jgi:predicted Zn-dependent protease with MMP-like domain
LVFGSIERLDAVLRGNFTILAEAGPVSNAGGPPAGRSRMKLSNAEFDRIVRQAIRRIPEEIRRHLDNILITVQKRPAPDMLEEMGYPPDEPLLGVYWGVPLNERSIAEPPLYPDTIYIFKEPLEEMCIDRAELEEEIEITVAHEVAHYLGMSEERLAELGYD